MTPEGRVKNLVTKTIKSFGDKVWYFMPVQRGFGQPALDYVLCVNGYFVTIETKRDNKHDLSAQQKQIASSTRRANGIVIKVYDEITALRVGIIIEELCKLPGPGLRIHEVSLCL